MAALTPKGQITVVVPMAATTRGETSPENKGGRRERREEREGELGFRPFSGGWAVAGGGRGEGEEMGLMGRLYPPPRRARREILWPLGFNMNHQPNGPTPLMWAHIHSKPTQVRPVSLPSPSQGQVPNLVMLYLKMTSSTTRTRWCHPSLLKLYHSHRIKRNA